MIFFEHQKQHFALFQLRFHDSGSQHLICRPLAAQAKPSLYCSFMTKTPIMCEGEREGRKY